MSERGNWRPKRRRQESETPNLLVQLGAALGGLFRLLVGRRRPAIDQVKLLAQFAEAEQLTDQGGAGAAQAILKADSILDSVMKVVGGRGTSFGERLRSLESRFSRSLYQEVWNVHKLRNQIAHEHPTIMDTQARQAITTYRRAASTLGAL